MALDRGWANSQSTRYLFIGPGEGQESQDALFSRCQFRSKAVLAFYRAGNTALTLALEILFVASYLSPPPRLSPGPSLICYFFSRSELRSSTSPSRTSEQSAFHSALAKIQPAETIKQQQRFHILHEAALPTATGSTRIVKSNRGGECQWVGSC